MIFLKSEMHAKRSYIRWYEMKKDLTGAKVSVNPEIGDTDRS